MTFLFCLQLSMFLFVKSMNIHEMEERLKSIVFNPDAPLIGGGLAVIKDNQTLFCKSMGISRLNEDGTENRTATSHTKYRTASISKMFTAIGIWQLEEKGNLSITDEASKYLDFNLTNPNFPDTPITIENLLSHTSSIRELDSNYNVPYNHHISEFFDDKNSSVYYNGSYSTENEAGYFTYVNMNYCLLGTIIEVVSGERFDLYMIDHVLKPLNITGSFNIYEMPEETLDEVGTIFRKLTNGSFDIHGNWTPTKDNFTHGYPKEDYSDYVIGTNGALYGPMGSLRISLEELTHLVYMFLNNGTYNNNTILKPETIEKMFTKVWQYDKQENNGDTEDGYDYAYSGGLSIITNVGKNRIHKTKNFNVTGHTANAYGLFGGVFVDRVKGYGIVYRGNGDSRNVETYVPDFSPYNKWAIEFIQLADDIANFDYPEINDDDQDNQHTVVLIFIIVLVVFFIGNIACILYYRSLKNKNNDKNEKKVLLLTNQNE